MSRKNGGEVPEKSLGSIFLHRSIRENWIWKDPRHLKWFLDLIMEVNYQPQKVPIGFDLYDCDRGQCLYSLQTWSMRWGVDVSTVRRFFDMLERDNMIVRESVVKTTRITVCNYDSYNSLRQDKQRTSNGQAFPTQSRRNPDAIQPNTGNTVNTGENSITADAVPPPPRKKKAKEYTEDEAKQFDKFQEWIIENAETVAAMRYPFTIDQFIRIRKLHTIEFITELLEDMHNCKDLLKKYSSANLTFKKWAKSRAGKTSPSPDHTNPYTLNLERAIQGKLI